MSTLAQWLHQQPKDSHLTQRVRAVHGRASSAMIHRCRRYPYYIFRHLDHLTGDLGLSSAFSGDTACRTHLAAGGYAETY